MWYFFKSARKKAHPINGASMRSSLPLMMPWNGLRLWWKGVFYQAPLCLGKFKLGYYEFEGQDKEQIYKEINL